MDTPNENITPEYLLQFRQHNIECLVEMINYIDTKKKIKDMDLFWERDFRPKNSWFQKNKSGQSATDEIYSEINDKLNKLNNSNFDIICKEIMNLGITCRDHMIKLVERIIEESISNHMYITLYAKMCNMMMPYYIIDLGEKIHFRDVLLSKCQETFEKYTKHNNDISRNELIGIVKFIGELYNVNVLISSVIFMCFVSLYINVMSKKTNSVEAICSLMEIVGKMYHDKDPLNAKSCYHKIEQILQNGNIAAKDKFTIMDLIDQKDKEKW